MPTFTVKVNQGNGQTHEQNVNLTEDNVILCPTCGGGVLQDGKRVYRVPRLLIGAAMDHFVLMPVPYCVRCGEEIDQGQPPLKKQTAAKTKVINNGVKETISNFDQLVKDVKLK